MEFDNSKRIAFTNVYCNAIVNCTNSLRMLYMMLNWKKTRFINLSVLFLILEEIEILLVSISVFGRKINPK